MGTTTRNLFLRPFRSPFDAIIAYPVVGLTGKTPVADRGVKRNCLSVENERPVGRPYWRDHLVSTATKAQMRSGCEADRDVDCPLLQLVRNEFDEFVLDDDFRLHCGRSSFSSRFVSMLNWVWCSDLRSR